MVNPVSDSENSKQKIKYGGQVFLNIIADRAENEYLGVFGIAFIPNPLSDF